ncbi:DUF1330 domain-containing protein [Methylobacterium frigidaeris]|uniref:DUF1330 domain-containing protein n=1 Tax=Methylobacterium frigidaeris TaxID=2038277 RepID=A0AA37HJP7_9HYPH|nr:DUF1330 domain-containing protein [Methylobacterium frigidaeris]GJD66859.1 hypothetical protein MPEAHAMD_7058 [Methylobacterium frigidaeris]
MAKGYWIAHGDLINPGGYGEYTKQNGPVFAKFGARFVVRAGRQIQAEGSTRSRTVVLEFDDYETAVACYNSPEYQRLVAIRAPHAHNDLIIVEGYDGAQPA